jgi:hypothetical protein
LFSTSTKLLAQVEDSGAQDERSRTSLDWKIKLRLGLSMLLHTVLNTTMPRGLCLLIIQYRASYDIALCYLLRPNTYTNHNAMHIVHDHTTHIVHTRCDHSINSHITPAHRGIPVCHIECTCITYEQYCQMYAHITEVPVNHNTGGSVTV